MIHNDKNSNRMCIVDDHPCFDGCYTFRKEQSGMFSMHKKDGPRDHRQNNVPIVQWVDNPHSTLR